MTFSISPLAFASLGEISADLLSSTLPGQMASYFSVVRGFHIHNSKAREIPSATGSGRQSPEETTPHPQASHCSDILSPYAPLVRDRRPALRFLQKPTTTNGPIGMQAQPRFPPILRSLARWSQKGQRTRKAITVSQASPQLERYLTSPKQDNTHIPPPLNTHSCGCTPALSQARHACTSITWHHLLQPASSPARCGDLVRFAIFPRPAMQAEPLSHPSPLPIQTSRILRRKGKQASRLGWWTTPGPSGTGPSAMRIPRAPPRPILWGGGAAPVRFAHTHTGGKLQTGVEAMPTYAGPWVRRKQAPWVETNSDRDGNRDSRGGEVQVVEELGNRAATCRETPPSTPHDSTRWVGSGVCWRRLIRTTGYLKACVAVAQTWVGAVLYCVKRAQGWRSRPRSVEPVPLLVMVGLGVGVVGGGRMCWGKKRA